MSSFKKVRRSLRIGNVDWASQKFECTHHVQLVCEFLEVRDMLAMRRVDKNLLSRIDSLKPMAIKKVKKNLLKLKVPESLFPLLKQYNGVISGEALVFAITGKLFARPDPEAGVVVYHASDQVDRARETITGSGISFCNWCNYPEYTHTCSNIRMIAVGNPKLAAAQCYGISLFANWFDGEELHIGSLEDFIQKQFICQPPAGSDSFKELAQFIQLYKNTGYWCNVISKVIKIGNRVVKTHRITEWVGYAEINYLEDDWEDVKELIRQWYWTSSMREEAKAIAAKLCKIKGLEYLSAYTQDPLEYPYISDSDSSDVSIN